MFHLLAPGGSSEHQDGPQTALSPGDDIGFHAIADHHGVLGMGLEGAQGGAHHQRVRFPNDIGLDARGCTDQRGYRAGRGNDPPSSGPIVSGLVAMKRAPATTKRMARVIASKLYVVVSPSTTYSGS